MTSPQGRDRITAEDTYEFWLGEVNRIAADLADARADLTSARRDFRMRRANRLPLDEYDKLVDEVDELKLAHQHALMMVSERKREFRARPAPPREADTRWEAAFKAAAKSMLTGEQYAAIVDRANAAIRGPEETPR
jgi:hypothetical protein